MTAVCLIDTSIFCNILNVPGRSQDRSTIVEELSDKIQSGESILLPMTAIIETGNHIAHGSDGRLRREAAIRFTEQVRKAIAGETPFTPTPMFRPEEVRDWLAEFPDWASHSSGFGDLTIKKEWERQCSRNRSRRVYVWSLDRHLQSYDRQP